MGTHPRPPVARDDQLYRPAARSLGGGPGLTRRRRVRRRPEAGGSRGGAGAAARGGRGDALGPDAPRHRPRRSGGGAPGTPRGPRRRATAGPLAPFGRDPAVVRTTPVRE